MPAENHPPRPHPSACSTTVHRTFGNRSYLLREPAHTACEEGLALPLLVLVHCFGCRARYEIEKFSAAADAYGFTLLAPEGVGRVSSFNAPSCCGISRVEHIDDVGLIDSIVDHLAPRAVFASGFSNGGFMVSHLASASRVKWAGIAPTAGHEYELARTKPLPLYHHHCSDDEKVLANGCCRGAGCCCGIDAASMRPPGTCVATSALHRKWLDINRCKGSRVEAGPGGARCVVGTGCAANTTLCLHARCSHADWVREFVASRDVVDFFAREACERRGGQREPRRQAALTTEEAAWQCVCPAGRAGWLCLEGEHRRPAPLPVVEL